MSILQQNNTPYITTILTGEEAVAAQYIGYAHKKAKALSFLSRQAGGAPLVQRHDLADAIILITVVGNYKKVQIEGSGCDVAFYSGLLDTSALPATNPGGAATPHYPLLDSTYDYAPFGLWRNEVIPYKRLIATPYVPQNPVATDGQAFARDNAFLTAPQPAPNDSFGCLKGSYLWNKLAGATLAPASIMTGRTRRLWQICMGSRYSMDYQRSIATNIARFYNSGGISASFTASPPYWPYDVWALTSNYSANNCAGLLDDSGFYVPKFPKFALTVGLSVGLDPGRFTYSERIDTMYPRTAWLHVDSEYNYTLVAKTHNRIVITRLDPSCGKYIRNRLEANDPPMTDDQKDRLESLFLAYVAKYAAFSQQFGKAGEIEFLANPVFSILENALGVQTTGPGIMIVYNWVDSFLFGNLCHGYMGKASTKGTYMAEVWAHVDGPYTIGGGSIFKHPNGNITAYEHVYKVTRDPNLVTNPNDPPFTQEESRWTVTATNRTTQTYRSQPQDNADATGNEAVWRIMSGMKMRGFPMLNWEGIQGFGFNSATSQRLESYGFGGTIEATLRLNANQFGPGGGPQPINTFPLVSGVVPFYVIGFDDDEHYHMLAVDYDDAPNGRIRCYRVSAETGVRTEITNAVFPILGSLEVPASPPSADPVFVESHLLCIPPWNSECVVVYEHVDQNSPTFWPGITDFRVYRYTPKGGLEEIFADWRTAGVRIPWDRESAYRGKYVGFWGNNVAVSHGLALSHPLIDPFGTGRRGDYTFIGIE